MSFTLQSHTLSSSVWKIWRVKKLNKYTCMNLLSWVILHIYCDVSSDSRSQLIEKMAKSSQSSEISALMVKALGSAATASPQESQAILVQITKQVYVSQVLTIPQYSIFLLIWLFGTQIICTSFSVWIIIICFIKNMKKDFERMATLP